MKKKIYYAEQSLIQEPKEADLEARDNNRDSRLYAGGGWSEVNNGVGIIVVNAGLRAEFSWSGINYKRIATSLEKLEADPEVRVIALDINSPGGDVNGLFELTEMIQALDKPVYTFTSGNLASAAYAIASATKGIYATESANIGSVGVYMSFYDETKWMEKMGVEEISFYGRNSDKKNLDPKSKEGKEVYQAEIDELEQMLINNIAKYRGVTSEDVLSNYGHGLMFRGNEALSRGMIDGIVATFDEFIETIKVADSNTANGGINMAKETEKVTLATSVENVSAELLEKIKADAKAEALKEAEAKATEEAKKAVESERARVAELNKFASLPQSEIKALAEKAKANGTSVEDFKAEFNTLAFELFSKGEVAQTTKSNPTDILKNEADESAEIVGAVPQSSSGKPNDLTDAEKGANLAKSLMEKIKK